ncbi:MAG: ribosome maturation factor RimM [Oscillospiraceae bacterium]|jgi:16S rRNA processing protein RimM|nr:ribosome maturation factor RimM [Oscillospiraceae bacterium]MDD3261607.1 ribosome maturation factor RimM [Oscillospiraceae bacterium]
MKTEYLEAGRIVGTHGVSGELRLEPWCDSAAFLQQFDTLYWQTDKTPVKILASRVHKSLLLVKLQGITTVEQGDTLRGRVLCFRRADAALPAGAYFHEDLIGMEVRDAQNGQVYGKLTQVYTTGANDVYEVKDSAGRTVLMPAIAQVVKKVDLEQNVLEIVPMEGMFDAD